MGAASTETKDRNKLLEDSESLTRCEIVEKQHHCDPKNNRHYSQVSVCTYLRYHYLAARLCM